MAEYPGLAEAIQGATSGGQIDYPRIQRVMGLTNEQMGQMVQSGAMQNAMSGGTFSLFPGGAYSGVASSGAAAVPSDGSIPMTTSDPWLSADELRAKTNSLGNGFGSSLGGGSGGGGGGASGGGGSGSSGGGGAGGLFSGPGASMPTGNISPSFATQQTPGMQPINYQAPGGAASGGGLFPQGGMSQQGQTGASQGVLQMNQANPQAAIAAYQNTPGYQMMNAPGAYQQSPGYQFAVDQALQQVQRSGAARGLLESGSVMREMGNQAQGMALQDYGNWWNRQNQMYGDYQNRLAGLAGGDVGGQNAMATGQALGASSMQTGDSLGSLFGSQGNVGLSAYANTGAAQTQGMNQAANNQLQANSANTSTLLAGAMLGGRQF